MRQRAKRGREGGECVRQHATRERNKERESGREGERGVQSGREAMRERENERDSTRNRFMARQRWWRRRWWRGGMAEVGMAEAVRIAATSSLVGLLALKAEHVRLRLVTEAD